MSYDLTFYIKQEALPISLKTIQEYFKKQKYFSEIEGKESKSITFCYLNENTGVNFYFTYIFNAKKDDFLTIEDAKSMGYVYLGMEFKISYMRASFFPFEAMPVVMQFKETFNLGIFNPQLDGDKIFEHITAQELFDSWLNSNANVLARLKEQVAPQEYPTFIPYEVTDAIWDYMYKYPMLTESFDELDCFIPKIMLLYDQKHNIPIRCISWGAGEYQLLPVCELIILDQCINGEMHSVVIEYDELISNVGQWLAPLDELVVGLKMVPSSDVEIRKQIDNTLNNLQLLTLEDFLEQGNGVYTKLSMDGFIDVQV